MGIIRGFIKKGHFFILWESVFFMGDLDKMKKRFFILKGVLR